MIPKSAFKILTAGVFAATTCFGQSFDASKLHAGLMLVTSMVTTIDSRTTVVGDPVEARIIKPVRDGKAIVIPKGALLFGRVVRLETKSKRVALGILFDHVEFDGTSIPISLASAGPLDAEMDAATSRCDQCTMSDLAGQMESLRIAKKDFIERAEAFSRKPVDSLAAQPSRHVASITVFGKSHLRFDSHTKWNWVTGWDWE